MHLSKLLIKSFRSCIDVEILLKSDLTVLVGENNGGKTNIIDAIRLLTKPLNERQDIYPSDDDLNTHKNSSSFSLKGEYSGLSESLKGLLISAVPDPLENVASYGYRYERSSQKFPRGKKSRWAGAFETIEPERGSTDLIRHVYLPALRDPSQTLSSGSGIRVMALLRQFLNSKEEEEEFKEKAAREAPPEIISTIVKALESPLKGLTDGARKQEAEINYSSESLFNIARSLQFRMADAGFPVQDLKSSGMGYSNLLYIATVIVELVKSKEADLTLFLVEEPEAHLHPQLQSLVLEFLKDEAKKSAKQSPEAGLPEGKIQVVVTTHSPNLTSRTPIESIVVVKQRESELSENAVELGTGSNSKIKETVAIPICELNLKTKESSKINRYLDVTRASLLFSNRVMLLEGIAESILLPTIAKFLFPCSDKKPDDPTYEESREKMRKFHGSTIIAIDGVDFTPYVKLLLTPYKNTTIAEKVVVVTDLDPRHEKNGDPKINESGEHICDGNNRKLALTKIGNDKCFVVTNNRTLEYDLGISENIELLKKAYLNLHPKSEDHWIERVEKQANKKLGFLTLFGEQSDFPKGNLKDPPKTLKGDFSQELVSLIEVDNETFFPPYYLCEAVKKLVE